MKTCMKLFIAGLALALVTPSEEAFAAKPVTLNLPRLNLMGDSNLNGLLATIYGKVSSLGSNFFVVTDGYTNSYVYLGNLAAGNPVAMPTLNSRVRVTGIVGRAYVASENRMVLRPRAQSDLLANPPTTSYQLHVPAGTFQFSLPFQPLEAKPKTTLASIQGAFSKWDPEGGKWITYTSLTASAFGGLQSSIAYRWQVAQPFDLSFVCYQEQNERWLLLPKSGAQMVPGGSADVPWSKCRVTDGKEVWSVTEPGASALISPTALYFDSDASSYKTLAAAGGDDNTLRMGRAYWVTLKKPNLTLILPASAD